MRLSEQSVSDLKQLLKEDIHSDLDLHHSNAHNIIRPALSTQVSTETLDHQGLFNLNSMTQRQVLKKCYKYSSLPNEEYKSNPHYFEAVVMSKLACLKILTHAIKGKENEIMGMLLGTTVGNQIIITNSFELPVLGTETRVNAQSDSYEYMVQYISKMIPEGDQVGKIIGWYHSHPGYDCWLSSIDMRTQDLNQSYQDPYVAIVVDPKKSIKENTLCIGAFRTIKRDKMNDTELSFYELPIMGISSELDSRIDDIALKFDLGDILHQEHKHLFSSLIDSMKQLSAFNSMVEDEVASVIREEGKPSIQEDMHTIRNPTLRSDSFTSVTSIDGGSDVDMGNPGNSDREIDIESVDSSVCTGLDSNLPGFGRHHSVASESRLSMNNSFYQFGSVPHSLENPQEHIDRISNKLHKGKSHIDRVALVVQRNNLHMSYVENKKELLRIKMQEYEKLRFYKDSFTL